METTFNLFKILIPKSATDYLEDGITIRQALGKFAFHKFSVVPIINENGEYIGSISEGDILRYLVENDFKSLKDTEKINISEITRYREYFSLPINSTFDELYAASLSQNFIPMVDDRNIFIGIVRRREIMTFLKEKANKSI